MICEFICWHWSEGNRKHSCLAPLVECHLLQHLTNVALGLCSHLKSLQHNSRLLPLYVAYDQPRVNASRHLPVVEECQGTHRNGSHHGHPVIARPLALLKTPLLLPFTPTCHSRFAPVELSWYDTLSASAALEKVTRANSRTKNPSNQVRL